MLTLTILKLKKIPVVPIPSMCVCVCVCVCIYIYIYIYREDCVGGEKSHWCCVSQEGCCKWVHGGECCSQGVDGHRRSVMEGILTCEAVRLRRTLRRGKWEGGTKVLE